MLKQCQRSITVIHCFAHKLEMIFKDAVRGEDNSQQENCSNAIDGIVIVLKEEVPQKKHVKKEFQCTEDKSLNVPTRVAAHAGWGIC